MKPLAALLALALAACDDSNSPSSPPAPIDPQAVTAWEIGPVIPANAKYHSAAQNFSINMPLHPTVHPEGWSFVFGPDAEPHYITTSGSLTGKTALRLRYRIEAAPGTVIYPKDLSGLPSQLALYFQRCGEERFDKEGYRWYSADRHVPIEPGTHELVASLAGKWGSVYSFTSESNPRDFAAAIADTCRVGFVMGGGNSGVGHGVRASGPVRMVVTGFQVE